MVMEIKGNGHSCSSMQLSEVSHAIACCAIIILDRETSTKGIAEGFERLGKPQYTASFAAICTSHVNIYLHMR